MTLDGRNIVCRILTVCKYFLYFNFDDLFRVAVGFNFFSINIPKNGIALSIYSLREKCPNTEFFLVRIFLYSVRIQENTNQKKLRIWTLFTQ